ncbi:MAG: hypothetical protein ACOYL6_06860 [Bacteriovoracaceae bacterium]
MNKEKRVLILSPHYFPMTDGLGHYTTIFHRELVNHLTAHVLTNSTNSKNSETFPVVEKWHFFSLKNIFKKNNLYIYDRYLIQYVPFMYERRGGINFSFPIFIIYLCWVKKKKIDLMVHEINYPFELNPKSALMFFSHGLMMFMLCLGKKHMFVSTEYFCRQLKKYFFVSPKKLTRLPVGSNIPVTSFPKNPNNELTIGLFGKLHPAKEVPMILKLCLELYLEGEKFKIVYIGETEKAVLETFSDEEKVIFQKFFKATGYLRENEVSRELQGLDLFLAYFVDGLSTRRGSVMAALEHGVPVISTLGLDTDPELLNHHFIQLLSIEKEQFKKSLKLAIKQTNQNSKNEIQEFYKTNFSWKKIVQDYTAIFSDSSRL